QVTDDMNSIGRSINSALQLSRIGGGVGITLSNLREAGAPIKGYAGAASGVVPVMKLFEDSFSYSNQLGQRQGAGVVYLNVFHPDIIAFLSTKKENADEKVRVKTLSLGITVPDKFYELARKNEDMYLFSPYNVEKEYGIPFNYLDITNMYDELVANPKITKTKIKARDLETEISKLQQESGYPYIINIDTANKANPINGKIIMS
ncbi:ribonucleotide-diphosphate reductase subunit alpha, partial [Streptococcus pyogenes]|nr:ribonucleotide-diphosphate reductase subunit alpha [Streptococcus pyogenes]